MMEQLAAHFLENQSGITGLIIGVAAALLWAGVKFTKAVIAMWSFAKKLVALVEDLLGAEARKGVAARPGLMERMASSEEADRRTATTLAETKATLAEHSKALDELKPNHGGSMKDVLNATRAELKELRKDLTNHIAAQTPVEQTVAVAIAPGKEPHEATE